jgi:hypothetical protein
VGGGKNPGRRLFIVTQRSIIASVCVCDVSFSVGCFFGFFLVVASVQRNTTDSCERRVGLPCVSTD